MAITSENINLITFLDEYGAELSISRKEGESAEDFNKRVIIGYKNLFKAGPQAFLRELDYITRHRNQEVCNITFDSSVNLQNVTLVIDEEKIFLDVPSGIYTFYFNEFKFIECLINQLRRIPNIIVSLGKGYENVKLEKAKHLLPLKGSKQYLGFQSSEKIIKLPVENVTRVYAQDDVLTDLNFNDNAGTEISNPSGENLKMIIEYNDTPFKLVWSKFKLVSCNSDYFKSLLKDENGFLSSEGAILINKILQKQNTYWGR